MVVTPSRQFKNIYTLSRFNYLKYKEFVKTVIDLGRVLGERKNIWHMKEMIEDYQSLSEKLLILEEAKY